MTPNTAPIIRIIDYGQGNLGSIQTMLSRIGAQSKVTKDPVEIGSATHLILPGVGSFDRGVKAIAENGMREVLDRQALEARVPILGICLGAQLMTRGSEEGNLPGLGWFPAETIRFSFPSPMPKLPSPNVGWRDVRPTRANSLIAGLEKECRFYFVHSYFLKAEDPKIVALKSEYGHKFAAGLQSDNLFSAQFHPEKSHRFGMQFFRNFLNV